MVNIDFEPFERTSIGGTPGEETPPLVASGFILDPGPPDLSTHPSGWLDNHYHIAGPGDAFPNGSYPWAADNGSQFLIIDYVSQPTQMTVRPLDGGIFGLRSIDLAEGTQQSSLCSPGRMGGPYIVEFTGATESGTTLSRSVTLDMMCDGLGSLVDFETFAFDGGWNRLTSFRMQQLTQGDSPYSWLAIDNLQLRTVVEPSSLALAAIALLGTVATRRRRFVAPTA